MKHETKKQLIVFSLLILLFIPLFTKAAGLVPCGGTGEDPCTVCDLLILFQNVLKKALEIAFLIVIGSIVYGGFRWIFSGGNEANIKIGMKIMTNAIIGLMIVLCAWLIVNTVFWLIAQIGGKDYTGTWFHIDCSELSGWLKDEESGGTSEPTEEETTETDTSEPVEEQKLKCSDCGKETWVWCTKGECLSPAREECDYAPACPICIWGTCSTKVK